MYIFFFRELENAREKRIIWKKKKENSLTKTSIVLSNWLKKKNHTHAYLYINMKIYKNRL